MEEHESKLEIAILNNSASAIQFLKNQQWKICHYTLLIYAAIVATKQLIVPNNCIMRAILIVLIVFVSVLSICLNNKMRDSIIEHRKYVTNIYDKNKGQLELYGIPICQETKDDLINFVFIGTAIVGCILSLFIVLY